MRTHELAEGREVRRTVSAQKFATRFLAVLERIFGERYVALRFLSVSVLTTLCVLSATYLEMLLTVGARVELFYKYGAVFASSSLGLFVFCWRAYPVSTTATRRRNAGLAAFALVALLQCALDRSQLKAYPILLVLALPGIVLAPALVLLTRVGLRRAGASRHAAAWLTVLGAWPVACLGAHEGHLLLAYDGVPPLSAFFVRLGIASAVSSSLLISVGLIVCLVWGAMRSWLGQAAAFLPPPQS